MDSCDFRYGSDDDKEVIRDALEASVETESKIFDFVASPDEIIDWYFAYDPLEVDKNRLIASSLEKGDISGVINTAGQTVKQGIAYEIAASALVTSVYFPEFFGHGHIWLEEVNKIWRTHSVNSGLNASESLPAAEEVIPFCLDQEKAQFTEKDISTLLVAGEMMEFASVLNSNSAKNTVKQFKKHPKYNEYERYFEAPRVASSLDRILSRQIFQEVIINTMDVKDIITSCQHLTALLHYTGQAIVDSKNAPFQLEGSGSDEPSKEELLLLPLINSLDDTCTGTKPLQKQEIDGYTPRGLVHEVVWFIDSQILNIAMGKPAEVYASMSNQDMPQIGYPVHRHGFDMFIRYDDSEFAAQLKSKPRAAQRGSVNYGIDLVVEQNFQEYNPSNMQKKIDWYRKLIDKGIHASDLHQIRKKILKSAREYFSYMGKEAEKRDHLQRLKEQRAKPKLAAAKTIYQVESSIDRKLTRAERRALASRVRKAK